MKRYDKLIFVSNSDTCRGPMAEAILKSKFLLDELEIESKGLVVLFPEPVNQKAEAVLAGKGLSVKGHMSSQLNQEDFGRRTLVLVMEQTEKTKIYEEYDDAVNVYVISEYIKEQGDIPNPLGKALVDYGECFELLEKLITNLVVVLNEEELLC